ncbi:MFS transporter [Streptomyces lydicus]
MLAHFGAYTYVRPFLEAVPQAGPGTITALLLAYGATGILGDFLGGAALARRPHAAFGAIAALLAAAIALLPVLGDGTVGAALLLVLWDTA